MLAAAIWVTISMTVAAAARPRRCRCPTSSGMTQADAVAKLREAGFERRRADDPRGGRRRPDRPGHRPESQRRTVRPTTDKIRLTVGVAQALVKVPNVIGMSQAQADADAASGAKLEPVFVQKDSAATDKGLAFEQDKQSGSDVEPGTTVTVSIGKGVKIVAGPGPGSASSVSRSMW